MRAVVQRVTRAEVRVDGVAVGAIGGGLAILLGVGRGDGEAQADRLAVRLARLRIFPDESGRFDRSLLDTGGAALVISQFTLYGDAAKGNRPSFGEAADPSLAEPLYERVCEQLAGRRRGRGRARQLRRAHGARARQRRSGDDRRRGRCGVLKGHCPVRRGLLPCKRSVRVRSRGAGTGKVGSRTRLFCAPARS